MDMKGMSKSKGILAAALIAVLVAAGGMPMTGTSYATETQGDVRLLKEAEPVGVNEWEITLEVNSSMPGKSSDIVIVMDRSGSMNDNDKLDKAKEAAINFIYQIRDSVEDAQIAFMTYNKTAIEEKGFTDLSDDEDLNELLQIIAKIKASYGGVNDKTGGTNIQAGIHKAADLLKNSIADLQFIILVSDGEPTYSYALDSGATAEIISCSVDGGTHDPVWDESGVSYEYSDDEIVGNGSSFEITGGISKTCPVESKTHRYPGNHGVPAIFEAKKAMDEGFDIYSIGIGVKNDGRDVLKKCQSAGYIDIRTSSSTYDFSGFAAAISSAGSCRSVVTDPIEDEFLLITDGNFNWAEGGVPGEGTEVAVSQAEDVEYDPDDAVITWDIGSLGPGDTAVMSYRIKVKEGTIFDEGEGNAFPTNKETEIQYKYPGSDPFTSYFNIPQVQLTGGAVILKAVAVNEAGQPLTSAGAVTADYTEADLIAEPERFPEEVNKFVVYGDCPVSPGNLPGYKYMGFMNQNTDGTTAEDNDSSVNTAAVSLSPANNMPTVWFKYYKTPDQPGPGYYDVTVKYVDQKGASIRESKVLRQITAGTVVTECAVDISKYELVDKTKNILSCTVTVPDDDPETIENTIIFVYKPTDDGGGGGNGGNGGGGGGGDDSEITVTTTTPTLNKTDHYAYIIGYPDGLVRPLGMITREEVAVIFYRLMTEDSRKAYASTAQPFPDVDGSRWSNKEIATLYNARIIQGNSDGSFMPAKPITRAEFAAIAAKFDMLEEVGENKFPDIENHWANKYINSSAEKGWINGYGDGTFRPDNIIIRCEAMKLINEVLDRRVNIEGLHPDTKQWPDNTPDKWYYEIVLEATNTHDYERADRPKSTEKWTRIKENPVW